MCNSHFLRYILHQRYTNICGIILLEIVAVLTQVPKLNIMPMVFPLSFVVSNNITPVRSLDHIIAHSYVTSLAYFIPAAKKFETRMADKDEDNKLEYHLTSCVAVMVSIHCDASGRQWMPVEQLHAEVCYARLFFFQF